MINVAICGTTGAMGKVLLSEIQNYNNINYIGALSPRNGKTGADFTSVPDIIIDFSNTANLDFLLDYAKHNKCPLLICTTGFSPEQKQKMFDASKEIPVMLSSNTSLGINIFRKILKDISSLLNDFDVEIIEKHHNKKIDSPSGTAKTLAEDIKSVTNRQEIPIHAVRAGTIPGEHTVIFAGEDEILEIKHTALSKKVFAKGALDIAVKFCEKPVGFYLTEDLF